MTRVLTLPFRRALHHLGYDLVKRTEATRLDLDEETERILAEVRPFTLTSAERVVALCDAVRYITRAGIGGAIVECGVWRGGSALAATLTLLALGRSDRDIYLFDTFEGMSPPEDRDIDLDGIPASVSFGPGADAAPLETAVSIEEVEARLLATGYPAERLHLVKGRVEDTLPAAAPAAVALLRLDTDWYRSTRHELEHLFPRVAQGGVLIVDDYGHWRGAREAVDEYLAEHEIALLLQRIDYTGRLAVVPGRGCVAATTPTTPSW